MNFKYLIVALYIGITFVTSNANAAVQSADSHSVGDNLITIDDSTDPEWLGSTEIAHVSRTDVRNRLNGRYLIGWLPEAMNEFVDFFDKMIGGWSWFHRGLDTPTPSRFELTSSYQGDLYCAQRPGYCRAVGDFVLGRR